MGTFERKAAIRLSRLRSAESVETDEEEVPYVALVSNSVRDMSPPRRRWWWVWSGVDG